MRLCRKVSYCWWFRNPAFTSWYGKFPIIYKVSSYMLGGAGVLPSTILKVQQVLFCEIQPGFPVRLIRFINLMDQSQQNPNDALIKEEFVFIQQPANISIAADNVSRWFDPILASKWKTRVYIYIYLCIRRIKAICTYTYMYTYMYIHVPHVYIYILCI